MPSRSGGLPHVTGAAPAILGKALVSSGSGEAFVTLKGVDPALEAGVTDIRLFGDDHATPEAARIRAAAQWIAESRGVLLSVGLTRKFAAADHLEPRHWLQVNNIHLRENPTWPLG